jgi:multidrug efflux pump subunit AcrB
VSFPNLSALAVRERAVTLFFILIAVLGGLYAFLSLGRAEDPSFTVRTMMVSALWPGATAEEMRSQVADRLEKRIQEVQNLYRIESTIRPGRVDLQVEFQDYTPSALVPELFDEVRQRMSDEAPRLPRGVVGPLINDDFGDVFFALIALSAPGLPLPELALSADTLRDRLQALPGLQKALLLGERPQRVFIDFDLARLHQLGLAPQAVFEAIDAQLQLLPAGALELQGARVQLRLPAELSDAQQLERLPLRVGGRLLQLQDVAQVRLGHEEPPSYLVRAHGQDALLLGVVMQKGENGLAFGARLADFVRLQQAELPLGMELRVLTNQADAITQAVDLFQKKFLAAMAVVMVVSMLAIGWRAGLVVAIAIPLTLGLTFMLMKFTGINLDRITLGALIIALGLLVDDAIIAIEMMIVKMEQGWDRVRAATHAWNATAAPMLFGTLVTVAGFVPIGFAQSGVGEYAGNIFWVLAYALLASWLVAVVFTPYLGIKLLAQAQPHGGPGGPGGGHGGSAHYQSRGYQRLRALITACVSWRKSVVAVTLLLLLLSAWAMANLVQKQFFPGSDRPEVLISVQLPQGSPIAQTDATVRRLEALLVNHPDVRSLSAYVGAGAPRFFISANPEQPNPAFAKLLAIGADAAARERIMADLQARIEAGEFPEARLRVSRLLFGPPVPWPVSFRIVGPEPQQLRAIAQQVQGIMQAHPHTLNTQLDWDERALVLQLELDAQRLRLLGLTPRELKQQLQFQLDGVVVSELRLGTRTVQVQARGARDGSPLLPEQIEIRSLDGRLVPLAQIGRFELRHEEPLLRRLNREPFLAVQADVRGAQPPTVTEELWQQMAALRAELPPGYRIDIGGSVERAGLANQSIQQLFPLMVALMLIFIMLQMRSFSGTFVVVATAPLGLVGAVLALLLFQQPFGFVALLGLIGLAGILMRNTMILTQQVQDNFHDGLEAEAAVVEAAVQRARPVILTALAAALAFVPLTFDSFWGPLAYVLIGGVAVGTAITLFYVPALYALWLRIGHAPPPSAAPAATP